MTPEQLLAGYHAAMVDGDARAFADLYAPDGTHEFPFFNPHGVSRLHGPDEIRGYYEPLWANLPVTMDRVDSTAVHRPAPDVIIDELVSTGRRRSDGAPFRLAGLVILTVGDGKIINARDYMDLLGVQHQLG